MAVEVVQVAKSNEVQKNSTEFIDNNAEQKLQEFRAYIENSPLDEQVKWAKIFDEKTKKYELESVVAGNSAEKNGEESVEVTNSDWENIGKVNALMQALYLFPHVSEAEKNAVHDIIYTPINSAEDDLNNILIRPTDNESGHSDKNTRLEEGGR